MDSDKTLEVLDGTDYMVHVYRADSDYVVAVTKPAVTDKTYIEYDTVGERYLENGSTEQQLSNLVRRIIETDTPSLVGTYTGGNNGN